ncbi:MAG: glycoside hydrolase family 3 N-terminal domain-containing protein [Pyrinomonadaceae bacterium]
MKKLFSLFMIVNCCLLLFPFAKISNAQTRFRPDEKDYKNADKLLKKMSLDEKIGQLVHIGINADFINQDSAEFQRLKKEITVNKVGGITVFVGGVYETVHLVNRMQELAEVPLLISADFETGVGMRFFDAVNFPWNMAVAATGNPEYAKRMGVLAGKEARALGVQQNFAPVVDVNNNAENPVINVRSFGEDPNDVARFGIAFSEGQQSENVIATAKHFPGHGNTAVDSHRGLPVIDLSRKELNETEFFPFQKIIESGVGSIMISHISMPQLDNEAVKPLEKPEESLYSDEQVITEGTTIPATLSKSIINILTGDMKFDGLIVTDAMDMNGLTLYFTPEEGAIRAILAGNDVLIKPGNAEATIRGIKEGIRTGRITEARIDSSVRKLLAWKYKTGLFKQKITPLGEIDRVVSSQETRKLAGEISNDSITLVRNDDKIFPLVPKQKALVLCITNGRDIDSAGATFIRNLRAGGLDVERIALDERSNEKEIAGAIGKAKEKDLVIAGLFGRVRSGAKNSVGLPESGEKALRAILKGNVKTVSVAFGNPYLILGFPEMKNYVVAYGDMVSLQQAAANALMGKLEFRGKLPITIGSYKRGTGLSVAK